MASVSIYIPVITASAAILGAAVAPVSAAYQAHRQSRRDRQERHETAARQACIALLRAAVDLRTQVANNHEYHGAEMNVRLAQVRRLAADASVHAVSIALLASQPLTDRAGRLAAAAGRLAAAASENTDLAMGVSIRSCDFRELDDCIAAFSRSAVEYAGG